MTARIFVVEDHAAAREALCELLGIDRDLTVAGSAASAEEALEALEEITVDLLLVDMALPGMNGTDLIRRARERWPDVRCAVLSGFEEAPYVQNALAAGADGYILKGLPYELDEAIRRILAGEKYLSEPLR
ncbi:MAG TPA: response regulator transcription factor [Thermoanaerobaculia bacterium]|nr:response regulator transcription factor [Thermoanaerobaculia bacterium]